MKKVARTKLTERSEKVKFMLYGDPGTGKTTAMASLAKLGPIIYVDAESGLKASPLRRLGIPIENIEMVEMKDFDQLEALFWQIKGELEDDAGRWVGVVMDSISEIQNKIMEEVVQIATERAERKGAVRIKFQNQREDWGVNTEMTRQIIRKFRDLPCHVGFSALVRRDVDEDTSEVVVGPATTPAVQRDLMGYVDVLGAMQPVEVTGTGRLDRRHSAMFWRMGKWQAKDRFQVLPRVLVQPSFDRVIGYVEETLSVKEDTIMQEDRERRRLEKAKAEEEKQAGVAKRQTRRS